MQSLGGIALLIIVLVVAALIFIPMAQDNKLQIERERTRQAQLQAEVAQMRTQGFMAFLWTCVLIGVPAVLIIGLAHFAQMGMAHRERMMMLAPPPVVQQLPQPQINIMVVNPDDVTNRGKSMAVVAQQGWDPQEIVIATSDHTDT